MLIRRLKSFEILFQLVIDEEASVTQLHTPLPGGSYAKLSLTATSLTLIDRTTVSDEESFRNAKNQRCNEKETTLKVYLILVLRTRTKYLFSAAQRPLLYSTMPTGLRAGAHGRHVRLHSAY